MDDLSDYRFQLHLYVGAVGGKICKYSYCFDLCLRYVSTAAIEFVPFSLL